jgi:hypothetical protein
VEYDLATKKNEIMSSARNGMELGIIKLSKIRQAQKDKYCMFVLICRILEGGNQQERGGENRG